MATLSELIEEMASCCEAFSKASADLCAKLREHNRQDDITVSVETEDAAPVVSVPLEDVRPADIPAMKVDTDPRLPLFERGSIGGHKKYTKALGTVVRINRLSELMKVNVKAVKFAASQLGIRPHYPAEYAHTALYVNNEEAAKITQFINSNLV